MDYDNENRTRRRYDAYQRTSHLREYGDIVTRNFRGSELTKIKEKIRVVRLELCNNGEVLEMYFNAAKNQEQQNLIYGIKKLVNYAMDTAKYWEENATNVDDAKCAYDELISLSDIALWMENQIRPPSRQHSHHRQ